MKVYQVDPAGQSPATGEAGAEALDVGAVSRLYACSPRHATRMAAVGDIPAGFRLGNLRRWSRVAIIEDIARKQAAAVTGGRD